MCISGDLSVKKSESSMNLSSLFSSTNNLLASVESNGNFSVDDSVRSMGSIRSFDASRHGSNSELCYAMKSIHLSRVTDGAFITELKNEIEECKTVVWNGPM